MCERILICVVHSLKSYAPRTHESMHLVLGMGYCLNIMQRTNWLRLWLLSFTFGPVGTGRPCHLTCLDADYIARSSHQINHIPQVMQWHSSCVVRCVRVLIQRYYNARKICSEFINGRQKRIKMVVRQWKQHDASGYTDDERRVIVSKLYERLNREWWEPQRRIVQLLTTAKKTRDELQQQEREATMDEPKRALCRQRLCVEYVPGM